MVAYRGVHRGIGGRHRFTTRRPTWSPTVFYGLFGGPYQGKRRKR